MDNGISKAAAFLAKSRSGGFVMNGQIINALNYLLLSTDPSAVEMSRQITESVNKICGQLLNESVNQNSKPIEDAQKKYYGAVASRASDLCW